MVMMFTGSEYPGEWEEHKWLYCSARVQSTHRLVEN